MKVQRFRVKKDYGIKLSLFNPFIADDIDR